MSRTRSKESTITSLRSFLLRRRRHPDHSAPTAISLFSGAGLSDMGYRLAGFRLCVQVEQDKARAEIGAANFPDSVWLWQDVQSVHDEIVTAYRNVTQARLSLLVATPPCQGMSSSNPSRGKRKTAKARLNEGRNKLVLEIVPVAKALEPRIIVSENVRQILTLKVKRKERDVRVLDLLAEELPDYGFFETLINVADYGIPQSRYRAIIVGVHQDERCLQELRDERRLPWPRPTHAEVPSNGRAPWITVQQWFEKMAYAALDSSCPEKARDGHVLHFVPYYDRDRYLLVSNIPPHTGRSGYENEICPACGHQPVAEGLVVCPACSGAMRNRPIVYEDGSPRLIKGFKSSYRRMSSDKPAPPVMTNSSHVGSDNKIHPWEHRVLSALECADLQTVPRFFDWSKAIDTERTYLVRNVVGEGFPTYFAYLHGRVLRGLLSGRQDVFRQLARASVKSTPSNKKS